MKPTASSSRPEPAMDARPWLVSLLILFAAAWFIPTEASLRGGLGMPLNVLSFLWLAGLVGYLSYHLTTEKLQAISGFARVDWLWLGFFVWHTGSVFLGWYFRWLEPRPAIGLMWQQLALAAIYAGGRLLCRGEANRTLVLPCIVALGVSVSLFAWCQYLIVLPELHRQYNSASEAEKIAQLVGAGITETEPGSRMRELFESRLFNREPFGTFSLTNTLAALLVPVVLLSLLMGWEWLRRRQWTLATLWLTAWFVSGSAMALTSSRTAILAVGLTVVLWLVSRFRWGEWLPMRGRWAWIGIGLFVGLPLALVVGLWAVGQSDSRLFSGAPESVQYRLQYWIASSQMIAARPWFGWGPGNFQSAYAGFQSPYASETIADPHNFFFEIAATSGLPAALFFLGATAVSLFPAAGRQDSNAEHPALNKAVNRGMNKEPWLAFGSRGIGLSVELWFVLILGLGLGLACAWIGESWPAPLWLLGIGLLCGGLWWTVVWWFGRHDTTSNGEVEREMTSEAARWALLGLLLSLLASGGINYPVIGSCVVLLAVVAIDGKVQRASGDHGASWFWSQRLAWQLTSVGLGGVAVYMYMNDTLPVIRSEWAMQRSRLQLAAGNLSAGQYELRTAKQLDPWRGDAQVDFAVLELMTRANETRNDQARAALEKQLRDAVAYRPASSPSRRRIGEAYLQAAVFATEDRQRRALLELGRDWLKEAVDRKPVDAALVAQLSWLQHVLGAVSDAKDLAIQVERLGQLNPHADLRLSNQWFLALESSLPPSLTPHARTVGPGAAGLVQVNVEAWVQWVLERAVTAK